MTDIMVVPPPPEDQGKPDLSPFKEANEKKITWDERLELIKRQFPSVAKLDWGKVFDQDPTIAGRIINDILKVDAAPPGRPGKRPAVNEKDAQDRLRQMMGEDYSSLPFDEVFRILKGPRSIRQLAHRTHINRNRIFDLLRGEERPTAADMEVIAPIFGKKPQFFYEYRMAYIFGVLFYRIDSMRDISVPLYQKIQNARMG